MAEFNATFQDGGTFAAILTAQEAFGTSFGEVIKVTDAEYFDGAYDYTPTDEVQIIQIQGLAGRQDITIEAIPNNYGLIEYDGSSLMVS